MALVGAGIAAYLTAYQAGLIRTIWEPIFGHGSEIVLHSWVSHSLPVPDASLGVVAYLIEAVLASIGGASRWRTRPWIVFALAAAVCVFGVTSLLLVIAQPLLFRAWCTLCLTSAAISLALVGPAANEALASVQHLERVGAEGGSRWRAFWGLPAGADRDRPAASPQAAS